MRHCFEQPDLPALAFRKAFGRLRPATLEGGGKGGSAPSPPDPYAVANATTQTNTQTAAYNKALNLNNYSNPFGSQTSTQTGTDPTTGAPIYSTSISANPELQQALGSLLGQAGQSGGTNQYAQSGLTGLQGGYSSLNTGLQGVQQGYQALNSNIGSLNGQYGNLQQQLAGINNSIDPNAGKAAQQAGQNAAYAAQTQYLDPQFSQQQTSLESQLANQGLTPGSAAYTNAMTNFNNAKQSAYSNASNQAILTGSQIGAQSLNNQLNAASAKSGLVNQQGSMVGNMANLYGLQGANLGQQQSAYGAMGSNLGAQAGLYGQQVGIGQTPYSNLSSLYSLVPGNTGTAQSSASPANIGQNIYSNYQGELNNYNAATSSSNSAMGGLFGLGSSALMAYGMGAFSDRRLKDDIEPTGERLVTGLPLYRYRYKWDAPNTRRVGVMADDVRRIAPEAVERDASGFDKVNYDAIGGRHVLALR